MPVGRTYEDYVRNGPNLATAALLSVADILGDLIRTELTVVGGLVPSLIIPQDEVSGFELHCGTMDVDLGLSLALLHQHRHTEVSHRMSQAGFRPATDEDGLPVAYRWRPPSDVPQLVIDFLIAPTRDPAATGNVARLGNRLAAVRTPGLQLVLQDSLLVPVAGRSLSEAEVSSEVRVCGPGAFTILKARAFRNRGEPKDAYDLIYVLTHFGNGAETVSDSIRALLNDEITREALTWLEEDFAGMDSAGPVSVAWFRVGQPNDEIQADAHGIVRDFLHRLGL